MSVYIETSIGDLVVDLYTDECPLASKNFLKLCKLKYFHNNLFFKVSRNFIAQTGDPKNDGTGGSSVYGLLEGADKRCFRDEVLPELKHTRAGMLGMATAGADANASQFYITLAPHLDSLDGKHTLFGEIAEDEGGAVARLNAAIVDEGERPLQNIRIRRTEVLDDPFPDPPSLTALAPEASPEAVYEHGDRLEEDWAPVDDTRGEAEIEADLEAQKAANRKILLEMIGDRPTADAAALEEYIFVCKLNAITTEEDLETIFSRFGEIVACDVIRDRKTGDSLNYAFIGFTEKRAAEEAYLKMNNALIDDRRIKVDFSQSMHHEWKQYRRFGKQADGAAAAPPGGGGQLLAGGKFRLKSSAHGHGVGAALGLIGDASGHGAKHSRREGREAAREAQAAHDEAAPRDGGAGGERRPHERVDHAREEERDSRRSDAGRNGSAHSGRDRDRHRDSDRDRGGDDRRREPERRERDRGSERDGRNADGPHGLRRNDEGRRAEGGRARDRERHTDRDRREDRDRDGQRHEKSDRHGGRRDDRREGGRRDRDR